MSIEWSSPRIEWYHHIESTLFLTMTQHIDSWIHPHLSHHHQSMSSIDQDASSSSCISQAKKIVLIDQSTSWLSSTYRILFIDFIYAMTTCIIYEIDILVNLSQWIVESSHIQDTTRNIRKIFDFIGWTFQFCQWRWKIERKFCQLIVSAI